MRKLRRCPEVGLRVLVVLLLGVGASALALAEEPVLLSVDAREAPRHILHSHLKIPAKPGPLTLVYPKWMPGEHGPTGPVVDIVGLRVTAGGKTLAWRRDPADMYQFHVEVPSGASAIEAEIDFATPSSTDGFTSGGSATANLLVLSWHQLLLYPAGPKANDVQFQADLRLPLGWKHGTSLEAGDGGPSDTFSGEGQPPGTSPVRFKPVDLTTLVDSPVLAGAYFKTIPLSPAGDPRPAFLHLAADSEEALQPKPEVIEHYKRLVAETVTLFGARHYDRYHFLLTLSDHVARFGLEHHQSSDNRIRERGLTDDDRRVLHAGLLPHEMVHSWNGKYRRPEGLIRPDYRQPVDSSMLWVYEGLTNYLGDILTARSGLRTEEEFRDDLAWGAATLDNRPGREWRPLVDTATSAQILYDADDAWASMRRSVDFYDEGTLIWLEADTLIRKLTAGKRSLDDFCKAFHGGADSKPEVRPYKAEEVYAALGQVAPYDWKGFFDERIQNVRPHAPLGGVEAGGWRLAYVPDKPPLLKSREDVDDITDARFSLGILVNKDAVLEDVLGGSPAARAGLAPGMKMVAVNGRRFTRRVLEDAVRLAKEKASTLEILAENGEFIKTYPVEYKDGPRYPALVRDSTKPDVLGEIIKPHAATAGTR